MVRLCDPYVFYSIGIETLNYYTARLWPTRNVRRLKPADQIRRRRLAIIHSLRSWACQPRS